MSAAFGFGLRQFRRIALALAAGSLALTAFAAAPSAQTAASWPSRPVTIIVPYGPGAANDLFARAIASVLQKKHGQPFVVENRAGGGSFTGTNAVARAVPDGYTLLEHNDTIAGLGQAMKTDFNPSKSLQPLGLMGRLPMAVLVAGTTGVKSVAEFIAYAKANPKTTFYGTGGFGGARHLQQAKFGLLTGTTLQAVSYKAGAEIILDLAAGRIQLNFSSTASAEAALQDNKVRVVAYTGDGAMPNAPKAPTLKELGINLEIYSWYGVFGPPGMPADLQEKINKAIVEAVTDPEFDRMLKQAQAVVVPMTVAEFTKVVADEQSALEEMIRVTGIKPE